MTELKLSLILMSAPFVVIYALTQLLASYALYRDVRDYGRPALAVVEGVETATFLGFATHQRIVGYTLHVPGRLITRGETRLSAPDADDYRPGEPIPIVYVDGMPHHNALSVAHAWRSLASNVIAVAAYFAVLALTIFIWRNTPRRSYRIEAL